MSRRGCWCGGEDVCEVCCTDPEDGRLGGRDLALLEPTKPPTAVVDNRRPGIDCGRGWRVTDPRCKSCGAAQGGPVMGKDVWEWLWLCPSCAAARRAT